MNFDTVTSVIFNNAIETHIFLILVRVVELSQMYRLTLTTTANYTQRTKKSIFNPSQLSE